jgi:hypothetical protein
VQKRNKEIKKKMDTYSVEHKDTEYFIKKGELVVHSFFGNTDGPHWKKKKEKDVHVTFLHSKGIDYAIYNITCDQFPKYYLTNLMTGVSKLIIDYSKIKIEDILYTDDFIVVTTYPLGQMRIVEIFNYDGEVVDVDDIMGERYYTEIMDGITVQDNQLLFNILIDSRLLNEASHLINFDTSDMVMKTYEGYYPPKKVAIIPYFLYPSCQQLISDEELKKMVLFIDKGNHYLDVLKYRQEFFEKDNMFKNLYDMNEVSEPLFTFTKDISSLNRTNISDLPHVTETQQETQHVKDLKIDDICDMTCHGLYTQKEYMINWWWALQTLFNAETFREHLAKMTLGCEFQTGSISKSIFPHGIGLKFVISTSDISYEYVIKMSLHELEDDKERVTYDKDKSKLEISLRVYKCPSL